jgi:hypothetical protein
MLFQNTWTGAEELLYNQAYGDYEILRVPQYVRSRLNPKAQKAIGYASNTELRFVMLGAQAEIGLRRLPAGEDILPTGILEVYQGDYQGSYQISPGVVTTEGMELVIKKKYCPFFAESAAENNRPHNAGRSTQEDAGRNLREDIGHDLRKETDRVFRKRRFSPAVTRVLLPYDWGCAVKYVHGDVRPPERNELPEKKLLVYGSSITHGGNASLAAHTYAYRLAEKLGFDLQNFGCAGSCYLDDCMSEYISGISDKDITLLEFGANVFQIWEPEELYRRARDFIGTVLRNSPEKPVFVTDVFYNRFDDLTPEKTQGARHAVRDAAAEFFGVFQNLYYRAGNQFLKDGSGLSSDGVHPSDRGHETIADGLYRWIAEEEKADEMAGGSGERLL